MSRIARCEQIVSVPVGVLAGRVEQGVVRPVNGAVHCKLKPVAGSGETCAWLALAWSEGETSGVDVCFNCVGHEVEKCV